MAATKDLSGQRFGKLIALRMSGRKDSHKRPYWVMRCDCGKIKEIRANTLTCTKSCGCARRVSKYKGSEAAFENLFRAYKNGAKQRNIEFALTKEDFKNLTALPCEYCKTPPSQSHIPWARVGKTDPYVYSGVDRINNNVGYLIKNCAPCCGLCNYMKRSLEKKTFLDHILKISFVLESKNGRHKDNPEYN